MRGDVTVTAPDVTTIQMFVLCKASSATISSLSRATCATEMNSQYYEHMQDPVHESILKLSDVYS